MLGGFVGVAQVKALLVEPAPDLGPPDEVQIQPVVAHAAGVGDAVVVAGFVPAWLPVEGHETPSFPVTESREEAGRKLERCFGEHVVLSFLLSVSSACGIP